MTETCPQCGRSVRILWLMPNTVWWSATGTRWGRSLFFVDIEEVLDTPFDGEKRRAHRWHHPALGPALTEAFYELVGEIERAARWGVDR